MLVKPFLHAEIFRKHETFYSGNVPKCQVRSKPQNTRGANKVFENSKGVWGHVPPENILKNKRSEMQSG